MSQKHLHPAGAGMPSGGAKRAEDEILCRFWVQMKGLRIEFPSITDDVFRRKGQRAGFDAVPIG